MEVRIRNIPHRCALDDDGRVCVRQLAPYAFGVSIQIGISGMIEFLMHNSSLPLLILGIAGCPGGEGPCPEADRGSVPFVSSFRIALPTAGRRQEGARVEPSKLSAMQRRSETIMVS